MGAAALACGPSVSSIYEGNIRFEHCYRLDLDPNIASTHREACWREWTGRYTYGQTRDRLDYARRRIAQLASGDTSRPALNLTPAATAEPATTAAPAPVDARKPPPPMEAPPAAPTEAGAPAPGSGCIRDCAEILDACSRECPNRNDAGPAPCEPCAGDYRSCMKRCFE